MDPRTKLIGLLLYAVFLFASRGWWATLAFATFTGICLLSTRPPLGVLWRGLAAVGGLAGLTVAADALLIPPAASANPVGWWVDRFPGLLIGLAGGAHLWLLVCQCLLVTWTTDVADLLYAAERLLSPLRGIGLPVAETVLMAGIAARFLPTLVQEKDRILRAQAARGVDVSGGGPGRWRLLVALLMPLLVCAFRRAEEMAVAMEARGYSGTGYRRWRTSRWGPPDAVAAVLLGALLLCTVVSILPHAQR